jgi:exodeoxyribonuclease V beta subunit
MVEQRGEDLRLAYVALTRAKHQAVLWWAAGQESKNSALFRLLFARGADGSVRPFDDRMPDDTKVAEALEALGGGAPGCISVERMAPPVGLRWTPPTPEAVDLQASRFERTLDRSWRRTSYTGIIAAAHGARVGSEPEEEGTVDEPEVSGTPLGTVRSRAGDEEARLRAVASLWGGLAGGADVGTFVHRVLERTDFTVADLGAALAAEVDLAGNRRPPAMSDEAAVVAAMAAAVETPLGPLAGGRALRHFGPADRLNELHFELPLAGGDDPTASVSVAEVAGLLRRHVPAGDPLAGYATRLADPALADTLRGYLSGSLDLVLRIPGDPGGGGTDRFAVVDHKTNWLGVGEEPLSAWHYRPAAMAEAMQRAHYPLQALLYTVALHRYLRWRLRGYDPDRNLAGVLYLFLRGMTGADAPTVDGQPCGVFAWRPPTPLVLALSDLLDQGRVAA